MKKAQYSYPFSVYKLHTLSEFIAITACLLLPNHAEKAIQQTVWLSDFLFFGFILHYFQQKVGVFDVHKNEHLNSHTNMHLVHFSAFGLQHALLAMHHHARLQS
ncbi:hypothetical protein [Anaerobium acetethylicum]|uniref:hypothetical protein n=1 Tax=Anaerobium acetethylicum TaxID=1619234 RepID=UPI0014710C6D|nr:hypothetical protein [Anaerobium acetethylicum]